jgi:ribose 5-phosphate isomerase B
MRVHIGSDHAGFELKNHLVRALADDGHEVVDHGPEAYDAEDDYPVYCIPAAEAAVADPGSLCVVVGGSGNGEQIAANKVIGVRAVLAYDQDTATLGRQHNDANVIGIGARMHTEDEALELVRIFLATPFSGDPRHARRIALMAEYEKTRTS